MAVYAVYAPDGDLTRADTEAKVEFVREGFVWTAFLLPPLYLLAHRCWLGLLFYIAGLVLVNVTAVVLGAPDWAAAMAGLAYSLLIGMEAPGLRQWSLERKGLRHAGSIVARDTDEAEIKFFSAAVKAEQRPRAAAAAGMPVGPGPFLMPGSEHGR